MVTLHGTTDLVKNIAKWGGISIGIILILILLIRGGGALFRYFFPKPAPPPTVRFGILPAIIFPQNITGNKLTYTIDTVSGNLGTFPDRTKVYSITAALPNLLNLEDTRKKTAAVGFVNNETVITDTVYSFRDRVQNDRKLTINIVSKDFTLRSEFLNDPAILNSPGIQTEEQAKKNSVDFLEKMELVPPDVDVTQTTTQLLTIQNGRMFTASSLSNTDIIRVDVFQKDLDKLPIYYETPPFSSMNFLVGWQRQGQIVEANFHHQTINTNSHATYPLKPIDKAFDELKKSKGYIAAYYGTESGMLIKNVFLAYYMSSQKQEYLMPIYVFEGKNGFYAYVSALREDWIKK